MKMHHHLLPATRTVVCLIIVLVLLNANPASAEVRNAAGGGFADSAAMQVSCKPFVTEPTPRSPAAQAGVDLGADIVPFELEPLDRAALEAEDANLPLTPMRVGVERPLGVMSTDSWAAFKIVPGTGSFWGFDVHSPEARGLRLKFTDVNLPEGAELWIYSPQNPAEIDGPYENKGPGNKGEFWTKIIPGDTVRAECFIPDGVSEDAQFIIEDLAHIYRGFGDPEPLNGGGADGGECYLDVMCYPAWQPLHNATAHIFFEDGGDTFICSGTLLSTVVNDETPYFMTARHCLTNDTIAATVVAYWFYQTQSCEGANATYFQSNYADVLWSSSDFDTSLTMFEGRLPAGVTWAGWDANNLADGEDLVGISHPGGRRKKISFGDKIDHPWNNNYYYFGVYWTNGTIEGGSSGSGIYRASNQNYVGVASHSTEPMGCTNPEGPSGYSKFRNMYSLFASYLQQGSDDSFYGNQSCATARLVNEGVYPNLVIKRIASDWFRIDLDPCEELNLTMSHTNGWGDLDIQFYDGCGGALLVEKTGMAGNKNFTYTNDGAAVHSYYLHVYLGDDDTRNTYTLTIEKNNVGGTPLPTPTNVQASDGDYCDEVHVSWSAVSGATLYSVWRSQTNNSATATQLDTSVTATYTDATTSDNVTYYYWVKAHNDQPCTDSAFSASDAGYSDCGTSCPGDLNGDNQINISDLAQLLGHYGTASGAAYEDGDLDGDGDVDLSDLAALLSVYGTPCP